MGLSMSFYSVDIHINFYDSLYFTQLLVVFSFNEMFVIIRAFQVTRKT